jgi:hypothetical protein
MEGGSTMTLQDSQAECGAPLYDLLDKLIRSRAQLWVEGRELRVRAADSAACAALSEEVAPFSTELCAMLKGQIDEDGRMMPLVPDSGTSTIYAVHASQGTLTEYRYVARALSPRVSFYGFQQLPGAPDRSVRDAAEKYCHALLKHRDERPFAIYGASAGGILALEMTRILGEEDRVPSLLILGDTLDPSRMQLTAGEGLGWYGWVSFVDAHCGRLWLSLIGRESPFWRLDERGKLDHLADQLGGRFRAPWSSREQLGQMHATFLAYCKSFETYTPIPPSCPSAYIRAADTPTDLAAQLTSALRTGGCAMVELACGHMELVRPSGAQKLAEAILRQLAP